MEQELRNLKESLDDTYFADLALSKTMKKKIIKNAVKKEANPILSQFKFLTSTLVAAVVLAIFTYSILQVNVHQANLSQLKEQQVSLLHFQNDIVKAVQVHNAAEKMFLNDIYNHKDFEHIERSRTKVVQSGEEAAQRIESLSIPQKLAPYSGELENSLKKLAAAYRWKNQFYQALPANDLTITSIKSVLNEQYEPKLIEFEQEIGDVYEELHLLTPRIIPLLNFDPFPFLWKDKEG